MSQEASFFTNNGEIDLILQRKNPFACHTIGINKTRQKLARAMLYKPLIYRSKETLRDSKYVRDNDSHVMYKQRYEK